MCKLFHKGYCSTCSCPAMARVSTGGPYNMKFDMHSYFASFAVRPIPKVIMGCVVGSSFVVTSVGSAIM